MSYTIPEIVKIHLEEHDVNRINRITQIYSKDFVFYRTHEPTIHQEFKDREFYTFQYHKDEYIDWLIDGALRYRGK